MHDAIRASISIPTVLTPFKLDEMLLIDGGVLNPLPINRVKRNENDLLIAVDVNAPLIPKKEIAAKAILKGENELSYFSFIMKKGFQFLPTARSQQLNYYTLLSQSASLMIQQISKMSIELYQPDIVIKIPMNSYGPFHFYKSEEIIESGKIAARNALDKYHTSNKA